MIHLTRRDGQPIVVNAAHIVTCEPTPDTLLTLHNGHKMMVVESVSFVVDEATRWFREIHRGAVLPSLHPADHSVEHPQHP